MKTVSIRVFGVLFLASLCAMTCAARATQIGEVDGGFPQIFDVAGSTDSAAMAMAVQADGRILLAGYAGNGSAVDLVVVRRLANGAADASFGSGGVFRFAAGGRSAGGWVGVRPDGRVVVVGTLFGAGAAQAGVVVLRLLADGTPDTTFSVDGRTVFGAGEDVGCNGDGAACGVVPGADGSLLLSAFARVGGDPRLRVYRMRADGSLDPNFGSGGVAEFAALPGQPQGNVDGFVGQLAQRADGRIVSASAAVRTPSGVHVAVLQLRANGTLDPTFGSGGGVLLAGTGGDVLVPVGIHVAEDGGVVIGLVRATDDGEAFAVARYTADGVPDAGFGTGGLAAIDASPLCAQSRSCVAQAMLVDPHGRIHVAGRVAQTDVGPLVDEDMAVVRFTPAGLPDATFGPGGRRVHGGDVFGPNFSVVLRESGQAMAFDRNGALLVAGSAIQADAGERMQLWRIAVEGVFRDGFD